MIAILFDIDGTLLASGGAGKAALELAFTEIFQVPLREPIPYSGRTDRAIGHDLLRLNGIADSAENFNKLLAGYLERLPDSLRQHDGRVLPGVVSLLQVLKDRPDVAIGLLTGNIRAGARVKLGHFQLFEHFAFGGFGDHHFDRDDVAREAFAAVHVHVGTPVTPDRVWVIGDTPLDVRCARAIGAKVVAVATGVHTFEQLHATAPELTLHNLSDPAPFLALLP